MRNYKHSKNVKFLSDIFQNKKKLIGIFIIIAMVLSLLTITLANVCGDNKDNKETEQVASEDMERSLEEFNIASDEEDDSEISIEDLPEETQEDKEEEKNNKNDKNKQQQNNSKNSGNTYYIRVNYGANVVTVYTKDQEGNYTVPVKAMICSTGTATPRSGTYATKGRYRWIALFGNVYGQYSMQIVGNILFHSVPYLENRNPGSLEYWEYDKLGTSASMGCVRLKVSDAKWIYDNIPRGTMVEFYSDSNPGPLGKPGASKISGNETCRGWDPTDPDSNNPWNSFNKKEEEKKQEQVVEVKEEPKKEPEVKPENKPETKPQEPKEQENKTEGNKEKDKDNTENTNTNNINTSNTTQEKQDNTTDNNTNINETISDNTSTNN